MFNVSQREREQREGDYVYVVALFLDVYGMSGSHCLLGKE